MSGYLRCGAQSIKRKNAFPPRSVGENRRTRQIVTKFQYGDLKAGPRAPMLRRNKRVARKPHMRIKIMCLGALCRAKAACDAATMARAARIA
jgi:hypothetical protein